MAGKNKKKTHNSINRNALKPSGKMTDIKAAEFPDPDEMTGEAGSVPVAILPEAFTDRMNAQLGDAFPAFLDSYKSPVAGTLRLNTLRMSKAAGIALCRKAGLFSDIANPVADSSDPATDIPSVPWDPDGLYYDPASKPGKSILHEAGLYYMQEASAMLPGHLLAPQPGERILDLCAAPGGKSVQIGMAMKGKGLLVSNEIHPGRAAILSENIERMGIPNVLVTNEDPARLAPRFPFFFDRILVDAPCSGEGMFRKHPEAALEWSPENVTMCSKRQLMILESAHVMLRPGGRMVYSTCTFSEEENENVIREFLQRHPEYHALTAVSATDAPETVSLTGVPADTPALTAPATAASMESSADTPALGYDILTSCGVTPTDPGCWRIYPHLAPGEGHFAAVLEKSVPPASDDEQKPDTIGADEHITETNSSLRIDSDLYEMREQHSKRNPKNKRSDKKQPSSAAFYKPLYTFMEETLTPSCDTDFACAVRSGDTSRLYSLGQQIYLLPENCPAPDGIKVQRPGLHLGMLKNDRFEPSLALARALTASNVSSYVNFCAFVADTDLMYSVDETVYTSQARCLQDYFTGNTLPAADQKGWTLVCIAGIGIGWGKSSGGIIKNHYPKGLRKQLET
ncbi:MAG: RsmB/NOP family class I SAM-dependent RNA methyltransferase [Lachnospiraceae bacterium]|nr:RsmB/NOP family class I SAM-dependent RNA methyltransferase [Lachnospiraceae bacterium]